MYIDLRIEVKLTGVGRLVESIIAKEVRSMYEGFRPLVEKFVQARRERQMELSLRNSSLGQEMMKSEALAERGRSAVDSDEHRRHPAEKRFEQFYDER